MRSSLRKILGLGVLGCMLATPVLLAQRPVGKKGGGGRSGGHKGGKAGGKKAPTKGGKGGN